MNFRRVAAKIGILYEFNEFSPRSGENCINLVNLPPRSGENCINLVDFRRVAVKIINLVNLSLRSAA